MTDIIKGFAGLIVLISMWVDLKSDRIKTNYKVDLLQYQVNELKQICGVLPK